MGERWFGFDDAVYVAARFLEILANQNESCDEIFNKLPESINTGEIKIPMDEDKKFKFMDKFIKSTNFALGKVSLIDGIRVDYEYGFGLIRPSNTSPYLIMCCEGDTQDDLEKIESAFRKELLKIDPDLRW
jgi:phosphomannomutase/phosphoglucomutase